MKLAVLADIHGNYPALQTVAQHIEQWQPDAVVVAGDIVNRGPRSLECLQFVLEKCKSNGWMTVRGNHEDYVIGFARPETAPTGTEKEVFYGAFWTYQQLNCNVSTIEALPLHVDLTAPNNSKIRITHASMRSNRDGIFPITTDEELRSKIHAPDQPPALAVCVGHTHWPLIRSIDETLVVNVGSAGLPFDGDQRVAYGQLVWHQNQWQAEIIRLDYDREQTERDFHETGYLEEAGPLTKLIFDEFLIARPHLFRWMQDYYPLVVAEKISVEEAAIQYLNNFRN